MHAGMHCTNWGYVAMDNYIVIIGAGETPIFPHRAPPDWFISILQQVPYLPSLLPAPVSPTCPYNDSPRATLITGNPNSQRKWPLECDQISRREKEQRETERGRKNLAVNEVLSETHNAVCRALKDFSRVGVFLYRPQ